MSPFPHEVTEAELICQVVLRYMLRNITEVWRKQSMQEMARLRAREEGFIRKESTDIKETKEARRDWDGTFKC